MKRTQEKRNAEKGITLIALVVTIVVLLILAGITINMLFSNGGIFKTAGDAANAWNDATINEQESLNNLAEQIGNLVNGQTGGGDTPEEIVDITTVTDIVQKEQGQKAKDSYGNVVVVPKGFKVVTSEATTVPEGIVIEDGTGTETTTGNQFVWIPVGTVYKDSTGTNTSTIKLGRYTFDTSNGTPTIQQAAFSRDNPSNASQTYANDVTISSRYHELTTYRPGVASTEIGVGLNATAKNLKAFVESVSENGGYYLARYEASYGSGSSTSDWKPLSKVSIGTPRKAGQDSTPLTQGMLWNHVTQLDASKICQNMYQAGDTTVGVESDLVNSYAWDTAIVFIQSMNSANSNYANKKDENETLRNTGETGDEVCNIFDMAANVREWSTEYSTYTSSSGAFPCTYRGGVYDDSSSNFYTACRYSFTATDSYSDVGFRVSLYIK